MTCLHCGKKLGFFSRYKDTPFCGEDHLRSHQNELEHALIERLGSKTSTSSPVSAGAPIPIADRPMGKQNQAGENAGDWRDPAPLCEEFFGDFPTSVPDLRVNIPLLPSSSFAIIVQADCCTPSTPEPDPHRVLPLYQQEFAFDSSSVGQFGLEGVVTPVAPVARGPGAFGEPWLVFPDSGPYEIFTEFGTSVELEALAYEAFAEPPREALGHRDALTPRPRNRFPYAASELSTGLHAPEDSGSLLQLSGPGDWDAVEPSVGVRNEGPAPELPPILTFPEDSLSVAALVDSSPGTAELGMRTEVLPFNAPALEAGADLYISFAGTPVIMSPILLSPIMPGVGSRRPVLRSWARRDGDERMPPLPFPSLFQLGPVLPLRPESVARS